MEAQRAAGWRDMARLPFPFGQHTGEAVQKVQPSLLRRDISSFFTLQTMMELIMTFPSYFYGKLK